MKYLLALGIAASAASIGFIIPYITGIVYYYITEGKEYYKNNYLSFIKRRSTFDFWVTGGVALMTTVLMLTILIGIIRAFLKFADDVGNTFL